MPIGSYKWKRTLSLDLNADSDGRLTSIQRLGGLKLASSQVALHHVIEQGTVQESKCPIFAARRTGDVTVLPKIKQLFANGDRRAPESAIALELRNTADLSAVPDLIEILDESPGELARSVVTTVLGEKLKDPRALPSLGAHLSNPDRYVQYNALIGLSIMTHADACTPPPAWTESDVEPKTLQCKTWWEQEGKVRTWMREKP